MEAYQQRVCDEALELQDKLVKLHTFQRSVLFATVPPEERARLFEQARHMQAYYHVLCERIAHFVPSVPANNAGALTL